MNNDTWIFNKINELETEIAFLSSKVYERESNKNFHNKRLLKERGGLKQELQEIFKSFTKEQEENYIKGLF